MDTKAEPEWLHDLPKAESLPWEELFGGREDLKKKKKIPSQVSEEIVLVLGEI